ncbi:hypothetical protein ACVRY7_01470 [Streptococcus ictaluri]|uniref:Uncharacterized protein n=1 Tax=Streptococcus ictaluri 707-05 TaxID=764299 RepID=G5JZG1_9STRE|nr:hypothetical protein [Streptococcus ictaluri]EHI70930.1 hypothetical protein STRIC_0672 [Streptococcus ictaluri 707-05]
MKWSLDKKIKCSLWGILLAIVIFFFEGSAQAYSTYDGDKINLWWNGDSKISKYVDYSKEVVGDRILWRVFFNSAQEEWAKPVYTVFLPKEVDAPEGLSIIRYQKDGKKSSYYKKKAEWVYEYESQRGAFDKEWQRLPGQTGDSYGLQAFTYIKDLGDFSRVMIEHDYNPLHKTSDKVEWRFYTKVKAKYQGKEDRFAFLAGMQQNDIFKNFPSFRGQLSKFQVTFKGAHKQCNALEDLDITKQFDIGHSLDDLLKNPEMTKLLPPGTLISNQQNAAHKADCSKSDAPKEDRTYYVYKEKEKSESPNIAKKTKKTR